MLRIIIYIFPILINIVLGGVMFITTYRFSQAGSSEMLITGTMATWAIVYSLSSLLVGKMVTEKNAAKIIIQAGCFLALVSLAFIVFPSLYLQFLWIALIGVGSAFYCTPFQVFMKSFEGAGASSGIVYSTAMYTAAWSTGMACGPLIFGVLDGNTAFYINAAFSFCMAMGIFIIEKIRAKIPMPTQNIAQAAEIDYDQYPDLAWLGWLCAGVGASTISIVRTLEPKLAVDLHISKLHAGSILALVSIMQVVWGLAWIKSKRWMFKPRAAAAAGLCGLVGLLLFAFGKSLPFLYLAAFLYGTYSCFFFFTMVFYSLVHPINSSRYLAINEAVVGISGIVGAIGGGIIAYFTNLKVIFTLSAAVVAINSIHRVYVLQRAKCKK